MGIGEKSHAEVYKHNGLSPKPEVPVQPTTNTKWVSLITGME